MKNNSIVGGVTLDNCYFCTSNLVAVESTADKRSKVNTCNWNVICVDCGAKGSTANSYDDAVALWNRTPEHLQDNTTPKLF